MTVDGGVRAELRPDILLAGRYRLRRPLGAGGMSVVWAADDQVLERQVAIKVLATELADQPAFRKRVRNEARAAAKLLHPHVVNVFDYCEVVAPTGDVLPFVVMELVVGELLEDRLAAGPLPWRRAVELAAQIADALAAAHESGIVHRDITAGNVILTESGAKVVDFGISAAIGDRDLEPGGAKVLGTPAYLAPERLGGLPVAPPADVYSLGVLLHTMLAGAMPFAGETTTTVMQAHWYQVPQPLPAIPGMPPEVDRLRRRCLAKRAKDRPTAAEVVAALRELSATATQELEPPPPPRTRKRGRLLAAAAVALTVVGVVVAAAETIGDGRGAGHAAQSTAAPVPEASQGLYAASTPNRSIPRSPTASPSQAPAASPSASGRPESGGGNKPGSCSITWAVTQQWQDGFNAAIGINSDRPLDGWTLTFTFQDGQRVSDVWGADGSQKGSRVTLTSPDNWNTDGSSGAGLTASYHTRNNPPASFALNGVSCTLIS